eukprot:TRINITY_DN27402_c0_g1_i1.p1 TRINITY_DN27402_c0_g1~~TRINITY_DN27402_c0_g1_i1.p1  ORF type:complete len:664 (+),score=117.76 TRINITY_DN27402_c0_g1_i1:120-2111(+)
MSDPSEPVATVNAPMGMTVSAVATDSTTAAKAVAQALAVDQQAPSASADLIKAWPIPSWCAVPGEHTPRRVLRLRDMDGASHGRAFDLSGKAFFVGRHFDSDIQAAPKAESVSRRHAVVLRNAEGCTFVVDLWSTNGTFLGGEKIEPGVVTDWCDGEALCFGGAAASCDCEEATLVKVVGEPRRSLCMQDLSRSTGSVGGAKRSRDDLLGAPRAAATAFRKGSADARRKTIAGRRLSGSRDKASVAAVTVDAPPGSGLDETSPGSAAIPSDASEVGASEASSSAAASTTAPTAVVPLDCGCRAAIDTPTADCRDFAATKRRRLTRDWSRHVSSLPSQSMASASDSEHSAISQGGQLAGGVGATQGASPPKAATPSPPKVGAGSRGGNARNGRGAANGCSGGGSTASTEPAEAAAIANAASSGGGSAGRSSSSSTGKTTQKCDKCDGPHETDGCPHFKKPRDVHKDAWANYGAKSPQHMGSSGGNYVLRNAQMVKQAGDGSCLYHSLCFGLQHAGLEALRGALIKTRTARQKKLSADAAVKNPKTPQKKSTTGSQAAVTLRRELARFVKNNPQLKIAGDTLEEWVRWDANTSCNAYARRMAVGGWGGGIELAACSRLKRVNVHVYEQGKNRQYKRISCFNCPKVKRTIHVLYRGRMHYDALVAS